MQPLTHFVHAHPLITVLGTVAGCELFFTMRTLHARIFNFPYASLPSSLKAVALEALHNTRVAAISISLNLAALGVLFWYKSHPLKHFPLPPFVEDLTEAIAHRERRSFVGTDQYIAAIETALLHPDTNSCILVGERGVGKRVVVEELAERIVRGPLGLTSPLPRKRILQINVAAFLASNAHRGALEAKIAWMLKTAKQDPSVIFFVPEIHQFLLSDEIGNLLKPALGRNEIRLIGTTTPFYYAHCIAEKPAFFRRFHPISIAMPDQWQTFQMIQHQKEFYAQRFPNMTLQDDGIIAAINLACAEIIYSLLLHHNANHSLPSYPCQIIGNAFATLFLSRANPQTPISIGVREIATVYEQMIRPVGVLPYTAQQLEYFLHQVSRGTS